MSTHAGLYILQIYMLLKNKIEIQLTWFVGFLVYDTIKSVHHMHVLFYQVKLEITVHFLHEIQLLAILQ